MSTSTNKRRRPLLVALRLAAMIFALVIAAAMLALIVLVFRSRAFLKLEAERDRARGLPVTFAELNFDYHDDVEADRLGAALSHVFTNDYNATHEIAGEEHYASRFAKFDEEIAPESIEHLKAHVAANREYFANLRPLVDTIRDVRFPVDKSGGWDAVHLHWAQVRNAIRMQSCQLYLAANDGDASRALAAITDGIVLSETLRAESTLIPQLVRNVCHTLSRNQIEYALNQPLFSSADISRIESFASEVKLSGFVQEAMVGEKVLAYNPASDENDRIPNTFMAGLLDKLAKLGLMDVWRASSVAANISISEIGDLPPWERKGAGEELARSIERKLWLTHLLARISTRPAANAYEAENRGVAGHESMMLAVHALQFAGQYGRLPDSMDELIPELINSVPIDPFDGAPIRYRRAGTSGFVVYSIGHDRDDDGGVGPREGASILDDGDIVFRVLDATRFMGSGR